MVQKRYASDLTSRWEGDILGRCLDGVLMRSSLISAVHGLTPRSESSIDRMLFEKACAIVTAWAASEERIIAAPAEHLLADAIALSARRYAPRVSELERGCQMVLRPWVGKGRQVALSEIMLWRRSEQRLCTYRSRKPFEKLSGGDYQAVGQSLANQIDSWLGQRSWQTKDGLPKTLNHGWFRAPSEIMNWSSPESGGVKRWLCVLDNELSQACTKSIHLRKIRGPSLNRLLVASARLYADLCEDAGSQLIERSAPALMPVLAEHELSTMSALRQLADSSWFLFCTGTTKPEAQSLRARWCYSFPFFRKLAEGNPSLISAIDQGTSFIRAVSEEYRCPPGLVRRMRFCSLAEELWPLREQEELWRLGKKMKEEDLLRQLSAVPLSKIPKFKVGEPSELSSNLMRVAVLNYSLAERLLGDESQDRCVFDFEAMKVELLRRLGCATNGNWAKLVEKREVASHLRHVPDFIRYISRATTMVGALREFDLGSRLEPEKREALVLWSSLTTACGLAQECNVTRLAQISSLWHKQVGGWRSSRSYLLEWPALCAPQSAPNGCLIVPLSDSTQLIQEGAAMHHCVGSYSESCANNGSHIFSIQTADGVRLSTLELRERKVGKVITLQSAQNLGPTNSAPCHAARETGAWFVEQLNTGAIPVDWSEIHRVREGRNLDNLCGFAVMDDEAWLKSYQAVLPFLPRKLAKPTPQEFNSTIDLSRWLVGGLKHKMQN